MARCSAVPSTVARCLGLALLVLPLCTLAVVGCASHAAAPPGSAEQRAATTPSDNPSPSPSAGEGAAGGEAAPPDGNAQRAPDFELDRLDGGSFRLSERLGKDVILIDFWATYCEPCLAAMPHLSELYAKHKADGLLILGVAIDGPGSSAEIHSTIARLGVQFPILLDADSRVVAQYNPRVSAPYSVLIGRDGRIIARQEGYTSGKADALRVNIERALGTRP